MKIAVGAIVQESNTFSPHKSTMEHFRSNVYYVGEQIRNLTIDNEVMGAFQAARDEQVEIVPVMCLYAVSSGVFAREAFSELKQLVASQMQSESVKGCDGVFFALHGAMVAEDCDDVEGEIMAEIRRIIGGLPFVVSLDLHANVTQKMVANTDAIVGYQTYPHVDFFSTGYRAAMQLFSIIRGGEKPAKAMRKIPMIVPAENSQSAHGPFAEIWKEAVAGEQSGESIVTSLFPVQPWLDIEEMGTSVVVVSDDSAKAEREAERLAELFWQRRHEFDIRLYSVRDMVELADRLQGKEGPIVMSDSADSPGAGSTGDSPAVLRELLELGAQDRLRCLLVITDAPAVDRAIRSGVGTVLELSIGHTLNPAGEPLTLQGKVRRVGDGLFRLNGGHAKNTIANMGRCFVLEVGGISLLIGEKPVFTGDPSMYRSMGMEPSEADLILVKSANQFRADYEAVSRHIYILDTPGNSTANLKTLTFQKLPHPFYPFQDHFDWRKSLETQR